MLSMERIKTCRVCGSVAKGFAYNQLTCNACKIFFHRHDSKITKFKCRKSDGNCSIDLIGRKCSACRLKRCIDLGMRKNNRSVKEDVPIEISNNKSKETSQVEQFIETFLSENAELEGPKEIILNVTSHKSKKSIFQLTRYESELLQEITKAMSIFKDERAAKIVKRTTSLIEVFSFSDIYFKSIVCFCQSLTPFAQLKQSDQFILLKAFCFDAIATRFGFMMDSAENGYPMILNDEGTQAVFVTMDLLEQANLLINNAKERAEYMKFWHCLPRVMDSDKTIRDLIITIMLFKPNAKLTCGGYFVKFYFVKYANLLFKYLKQKYRNVQKAERKFVSILNLLDNYDWVKNLEKMVFKEMDVRHIPHIVFEIYNLTE